MPKVITNYKLMFKFQLIHLNLFKTLNTLIFMSILKNDKNQNFNKFNMKKKGREFVLGINLHKIFIIIYPTYNIGCFVCHVFF